MHLESLPAEDRVTTPPGGGAGVVTCLELGCPQDSAPHPRMTRVHRPDGRPSVVVAQRDPYVAPPLAKVAAEEDMPTRLFIASAGPVPEAGQGRNVATEAPQHRVVVRRDLGVRRDRDNR